MPILNCKKCKGSFCYHERLKGKEPRLNPMLVKTEECIDTLDRIVAHTDLDDANALKIARNGISVDPLCFAAATGHIEGVRRLIKAGADPNKCFHGGESPLMIATRNRKTEVVELLLKHGALVTYTDFEGFNSFMLAVLTGDAKLVNLMWLNVGKLLVNHHNNCGFTPLHVAADKSWESCVQFLLTNGACPNMKSTKMGTTPLMISAMKGDLGSAEKIVARGANVLQEDSKGLTSVCLAHDKEKEQMVMFLLSKIVEQEKGDAFVKSRIERIRKCDLEDNSEHPILDVITELFHTLIKMEAYKDILLRQKLIPNLLTAGQKFMKFENMVTRICCLIYACMYHSGNSLDEKFFQQFMRSRGPDFSLKVAREYKEQGKREIDTVSVCLFPIVCIAETKEGKEWVQRNRSKISSFSYLSDECAQLKCKDEHLQCRMYASWRKFWREIAEIEHEDREQNMMNLLEEEERERTKKAKKREKKRQKRMRAQQLKSVTTPAVMEDNNKKDVKDTNTAMQAESSTPKDESKTEKLIESEIEDKSGDTTDPNWTKVKGKKTTPKSDKSPQKWEQKSQKGNFTSKMKRADLNSDMQWSDMLKNRKAKSPTDTKKTTTPNKKENVNARLDYDQEFPSLTHSSSATEKVKGENSSISCLSESKSAISDVWSSEGDPAIGSLSGVTCDEDIPLWVLSESYESDDTGSVHSYWERSLDFEENARPNKQNEPAAESEKHQDAKSPKKEENTSSGMSSRKSSPTIQVAPCEEKKIDKENLLNFEAYGGYDKSNHMPDKDTKIFDDRVLNRYNANVSRPSNPLTLSNVADSLKSSISHNSDNNVDTFTKKEVNVQLQSEFSNTDGKEMNNLYTTMKEDSACIVEKPNIVCLKGGRTLEEVEAELFQNPGNALTEVNNMPSTRTDNPRLQQKVAVIEPIGRPKKKEAYPVITNNYQVKMTRDSKIAEQEIDTSMRRLTDIAQNAISCQGQASWSLGIGDQITRIGSRREASDRIDTGKERYRNIILESNKRDNIHPITNNPKNIGLQTNRVEESVIDKETIGKGYLGAGFGNCYLGDSILRNALSIQHIPTHFSYVSDLNLEEGDSKRQDAMFCSFPSVHDEDNKRNEDEKFEMTMQKMQQLHKQHLEKYALSKGSDLMAGDGPSSDLQYYACCAGFPTNQEKTFCHDRLQNGNEVSSTNNLKTKGFGWSNATEKGQNPEQCPIQPPPDNVIGNISPPSLRELKETNDTLSNRPTSGDFFSRDGADVVGDVPKRKWTPHSKRWRGKLTELWHLPPDRRTQIGNIVLPCDKNAFKIAYADRDATLGFLADGTEVAVITMKRNDDVTNNFEQLLSPCYDNTFLVRYKSYETDGDTCFVALELFEYTLAEYVKDPALNDQLHDLTKWTWQILKGIAALHNTCDTLHGNIMPSNTLVDVDGRIRLSAYGLSTETASEESLLWKTSFDEDRKCWISTEVTTETEQYSAKSDIQVAGMLIHYLLTRGRHPYGENSMEISLCIQQNWHHIQTQNTEANDLIYGLLSMPPTCRPQAIDSLRHPYFWAAEKKLRLVLIAGSDVLRDMKLGTSSSNGDEGKTMIEILGSAGDAEFSNFSNWTHDVDPVIMREMRAFRQYKNTLVELVLFVYNCCLHFEKLPRNACDVIDEPCRYFLGRFPALCLAVYRAIQRTDRVNKICYKPFF